MQRSLFPVKILIKQTWEGTKGLNHTGVDSQGRRYALKVNDIDPEASLKEWICYNICDLIGIPHPDFDQVLVDNKVVFGSRWEESSLQYNASQMTDAQMLSHLRSGAKDTNAIFALDSFIPNPDRNIGNYLLRVSNSITRVVAFDWDRIELFAPWPAHPSCATHTNWKVFQYFPGIVDNAVILETLEKIRGVEIDSFNLIVNSAHQSWVTTSRLSELIDWWENQKNTRIDQTISLLKL